MKRLKTARSIVNLQQGRTDWYRIRAQAELTEVYLYDEIGYFGTSADDFVKELKDIDTSRIELHINSPGGDVFDGIAILNCLRAHKARVNVTVDGLAASAASFIAMAGDEILMARNAEMMIHDAHGLCVGNAGDMRELADRMEKVSDNIADIYAQRAGGSADEWRERMRAETWFSADEAVAAGLADSVAELPGRPTTDNSWDLSIYNYQGRAEAPKPETPAPDFTSAWDPELFRDALKGAMQ